MQKFALVLAFVSSVGTAGELSYTRLKADILSNHIQSTEGMLQFFNNSPDYQPLVNKPVLERVSGALHADQVSSTFPRIVMGAGNMSMHLTADPSKAGYNLIELIEMLPGEKALRFHLINFAVTGPDMFFDDPTSQNPDEENKRRLLELYQKTTGGHVSSCDGCHFSGEVNGVGNDTAQNWSARLNQFRVYGHDNDRIQVGTEEYDAFNKFWQVRDDLQLGRLYRLLNLRINKEADGSLSFPDRPVQAFTDHVFELGRRKLLKIWQSFSGYDQYQFMIAGALMDCAPLQDFLPATSREVHERLLLEMSGLDQIFRVPLSSIRRSEASPEFWTRFDTGRDPANNFIKQSDFLAYTTLPLPEAVGIQIRDANEQATGVDLAAMAPEFKALYSEANREFTSPGYLSRLSKLTYIFLPHLQEVPSQHLVLVNEPQAFANEGPGAPPDIAAIATYRYEGANRGIDQILAEFGEKFLESNPELDSFNGHVMNPSALQTSRLAYCARLQSASLAAFTSQPLDPASGLGKNGDLCGTKNSNFCAFPMSCNDRGDGVKACTGAERFQGLAGDLCAGVPKTCSSGLTCLADGDGVFVCEAEIKTTR